MKIKLSLILILFISILSVSGQNLTIEQKNQVCLSLNFTYADCFNFWSIYDTPLNCSNTTIIINETIFVNRTIDINHTYNNTIYLDKNCSEFLMSELDYKKAEWDFQLNMAKIGLNASCIDSINCEDCDKFCESKVLQIKSQYEDNQNNKKSDFEENFIFYLLTITIVGFIIYYVYRNFYKKQNSSNNGRNSFGGSYVDPPKPTITPQDPVILSEKVNFEESKNVQEEKKEIGF